MVSINLIQAAVVNRGRFKFRKEMFGPKPKLRRARPFVRPTLPPTTAKPPMYKLSPNKVNGDQNNPYRAFLFQFPHVLLLYPITQLCGVVMDERFIFPRLSIIINSLIMNVYGIIIIIIHINYCLQQS